MQKPMILLVDDSPMMTQFLGIFLSKKYTVETKNNPYHVLEEIKSGKRPDLIVTDLDMPELNGKDLIKEIKALLPNTPVIVVSAVKESKQRITCLELGATDFLSKPFHPAELEVRINKALSEKAEVQPKLSFVREMLKAAAIF
jgi:DNA-binding response OmpR family regulator